MEEKAGNAQAALAWAKRASESALGGATRLQWMSNELILTNKIKAKRSQEEIAQLAKTFYDLLLSMPGGFSGRNLRSAKRFAKELSSWKDKEAVEKILRGAKTRCEKQAKNTACKAYFTPLLAQ